MLDKEESSESSGLKTYRVIKEKRFKRRRGTVQDTEWRVKEDPEDCDRKSVYYWNRVQWEYEN